MLFVCCSYVRMLFAAFGFFFFYIFWILSQNFIEYLHDYVRLNITKETYCESKNSIIDISHHVTSKIHQQLKNNKKLSSFLLFLSSAFIDIIVFGFFFRDIFYGLSKPVFSLIICTLLRQLCQVICQLPVPKDIIWYHPGIPSLLVIYDIQSDLFFSGHTYTAILMGIGLLNLEINNFWILLFVHSFSWLFMMGEIAFVLITHAHYFMDVYAGGMTAGFVYFMVCHFFPNLPV